MQCLEKISKKITKVEVNKIKIKNMNFFFAKWSFNIKAGACILELNLVVLYTLVELKLQTSIPFLMSEHLKTPNILILKKSSEKDTL